MKVILGLLILSGCTIELKADTQNVDDVSYTTSQPSYYTWTCDDDYYRYESWVEVEAVDCYAFKITATADTYDYYISQEDLMYDGGCDWYSYIYLPATSCDELYDVRAKAYY